MSVQRYKLEGGLREKHWCGQWIEYSAYEALESSLAEREQRIAELEAALRDMLEGHEDEDPNRPCIANARAALAATEGEKHEHP